MECSALNGAERSLERDMWLIIKTGFDGVSAHWIDRGTVL